MSFFETLKGYFVGRPSPAEAEVQPDPEVVERIVAGRDEAHMKIALAAHGADIDTEWHTVPSIGPEDVPVCNEDDVQTLRANVVYNRRDGARKEYKKVRFASGPPLAPGSGLAFVSYQGYQEGKGFVIDVEGAHDPHVVQEIFRKKLEGTLLYLIKVSDGDFVVSVNQAA